MEATGYVVYNHRYNNFGKLHQIFHKILLQLGFRVLVYRLNDNPLVEIPENERLGHVYRCEEVEISIEGQGITLLINNGVETIDASFYDNPLLFARKFAEMVGVFVCFFDWSTKTIIRDHLVVKTADMPKIMSTIEHRMQGKPFTSVVRADNYRDMPPAYEIAEVTEFFVLEK